MTIKVLNVNNYFPILEPSIEFFMSEDKTFGDIFAKNLYSNKFIQRRILPESLPKGNFIIDPLSGSLMVKIYYLKHYKNKIFVVKYEIR